MNKNARYIFSEFSSIAIFILLFYHCLLRILILLSKYHKHLHKKKQVTKLFIKCWLEKNYSCHTNRILSSTIVVALCQLYTIQYVVKN